MKDKRYSIEDKNQFAQLMGMNIDEYMNHPNVSKNAKFRAGLMIGGKK